MEFIEDNYFLQRCLAPLVTTRKGKRKMIHLEGKREGRSLRTRGLCSTCGAVGHSAVNCPYQDSLGISHRDTESPVDSKRRSTRQLKKKEVYKAGAIEEVQTKGT